MANILVTSINAKAPLLETLRDSKNLFEKNIQIIGCDISENIVGKYFVDTFWKIQRREDIVLEDFLQECKQKNVGYIVPTSDEDVLFFAKHKNFFAKQNIFIFSSPLETVAICHDKLAFYEATDCILTSLNIHDIQSKRFVVKERYGAGSKKIGLNLSKNEAVKFSKNLQYPIFQPFIKGDEYSVDTYISKNGQIIASLARKRELIVNAEAKITSYAHEPNLIQIVNNLATKLGLQGHIVTQAIKHKDTFHIIECNLRFGGASTLSYKMGLKSFYWFLCECHDKKFEFTKNTSHTKQVRASKDYYV